MVEGMAAVGIGEAGKDYRMKKKPVQMTIPQIMRDKQQARLTKAFNASLPKPQKVEYLKGLRDGAKWNQ
jgi:hypothetical protein